MKIAEGWTFKYNYVPSRKGAYMTIEKDGMEAQATLTAWLDDNLEATTKKKATHIRVRQWGGKNDLSTFFVLELPENWEEMSY